MSFRFIYSFLGLGAILCVVTCAGHIAAETVNGCCLYLVNFFSFFYKLFLQLYILTDCSIIYRSTLACFSLVVLLFLPEFILVFLFYVNNASVYWHIDWVQYMGFIVLLVMVEGGVVADIFLNRDWKKV